MRAAVGGFAVFLALGVPGGVGFADDDGPEKPAAQKVDVAKWSAGYLEALSTGRFSDAVKMFTAPAAEALAASPPRLLEVARASARRLPGGMRPGEPGTGFADWFLQTAAKAKEGAPEDATAGRALAAAYGVKCRLAGAAGTGVLTEDAVAAAENALGSYELKGGDDRGRICADAAGWLRAALEVKEVDSVQVLARMETLAQKAAAMGGGEVGGVARAEVELGRAAVALGTPGEAKKALDRFFVALQPLVAEGKGTPAVLTLHTEGVSFALTSKIAAGKAYLVTARKSDQDLLRYSTPAGDSWRPPPKSTGDSIVVMDRLDRWGVVRSRLYVAQYKADGSYKDPDTGGRFSGGDTKGIATSRLENQSRAFGSITRRKDVARKSFSKAFPQADAGELVGTGPASEFWRIRVWAFKGKETASTYCAMIHDFVDTDRPDPELEAVIDSLAEVRAKK